MATGFGDIFAKGLSSLYGPTSTGDPSRAGMAIQTGGKIFDYYQTNKQLEQDEERLRREQAQQRAIMAEQLDMARRRAGEESGIRQGIVSRTQQLEQALNQARAAMGQAPVATQADINQNYQQISDMMRDDYYKTMDRVSSQGFADAIAKGMDRSDRFRDTQRELGEASAEQLRKIDQEAYNAAISRTHQIWTRFTVGVTKGWARLRTLWVLALVDFRVLCRQMLARCLTMLKPIRTLLLQVLKQTLLIVAKLLEQSLETLVKTLPRILGTCLTALARSITTLMPQRFKTLKTKSGTYNEATIGSEVSQTTTPSKRKRGRPKR